MVKKIIATSLIVAITATLFTTNMFAGTKEKKPIKVESAGGYTYETFIDDGITKEMRTISPKGEIVEYFEDVKTGKAVIKEGGKVVQTVDMKELRKCLRDETTKSIAFAPLKALKAASPVTVTTECQDINGEYRFKRYRYNSASGLVVCDLRVPKGIRSVEERKGDNKENTDKFRNEVLVIRGKQKAIIAIEGLTAASAWFKVLERIAMMTPQGRIGILLAAAGVASTAIPFLVEKRIAEENANTYYDYCV